MGLAMFYSPAQSVGDDSSCSAGLVPSVQVVYPSRLNVPSVQVELAFPALCKLENGVSVTSAHITRSIYGQLDALIPVGGCLFLQPLLHTLHVPECGPSPWGRCCC